MRFEPSSRIREAAVIPDEHSSIIIVERLINLKAILTEHYQAYPGIGKCRRDNDFLLEKIIFVFQPWQVHGFHRVTLTINYH